MKHNDCSNIESKDGCLASALSVLGNKWSALILRDLTTGPKRFSVLERSLSGISPRTLSQRLDDLERLGIITKKSFAETPPRVEYTITSKGNDFIPALQQLAVWGEKYYSL
ncbi:MAG: helix-turn-helix domain-containing protein [Candidatus Saccharibacteria bacterium]